MSVSGVLQRFIRALLLLAGCYFEASLHGLDLRVCLLACLLAGLLAWLQGGRKKYKKPKTNESNEANIHHPAQVILSGRTHPKWGSL